MADNDSDPASPSMTASPVADSPSTQDFNTATPAAARHGGSFSAPPGSTVYTPTATPGAELNPRSCVTCRRRKVRCDKHMPCSNCRRAQIPCVFPAPERAPRRPRRKDPNALKQQSSDREVELMKRLRKLEGIVEELSGQIELETVRHQSSSGDSPEAISQGDTTMVGSGVPERADSVSGKSNNSQNSPKPASSRAGSSPGRLVSGYNSSYGPLGPKDMKSKFGRLVLNDHGRSRYVSSAFWSRINDELDELRAETQKLSEEDSDISDTESSPGKDNPERTTADHHSFIFGYRSCDVDLRKLHPLPSQIPYIWQVYKENVDPLVKILHIPTTTKLIRQICDSNMESLTPATEALMFAIYYSATTSLDDDEVRVNFLAEKPVLVGQYRFALEQALAKAEFLTSSDMVTLQALVLFLVLVRRHDDTRFAWTLTGLAIRICQSIGLHRDGTNFPNLTPFEIEMRRRLWWSICMLDLRSAEDQGTDLTISDRAFDTELPLNINDNDISPDSTSLPQARDGATDLTFSLMRYEICNVGRLLHTVTSAAASACPKYNQTTLAEREQMITDVYERVQTKFLSDASSEGNPMFWVAANIARVIVAKMTMLIYQPVLFPGGDEEGLSGPIRDRLFAAATEIFEYNHLLYTDSRTKPWRWLFSTYTQWHALAYVLMEVARRPWSASVERAWTAVNSVFANSKAIEMAKMVDNTAVWLPFRMLYSKARKHRNADIERLKADPQAAIELDRDDRARTAPASFAAMPGSIKNHISRERWRKLVGEPALDSGPVVNCQEPQPRQNSMPPSGPRAPSISEAQASHIMDSIFSSPTFVPLEMLPVAFSDQLASQFAKSTPYGGFGGADVPFQDSMAASYGGNTAAMAASQTIAATPLKDDDLPVWLWPGVNEDTDRLPGASLDVDVNMDENFDWQGFGENLKGFEMESGGSVAGAIWSSHI